MKNIKLLVLFFASLVLYSAQTFAGESPLSVDGTKPVNAAEAKALFDKGVAFVDVRGSADWDSGRIPGALHLELKEKYSAESLGKEIKKDQEVVIYCNGPLCKRSAKASKQAVDWGYSKVYYFREGFPSWQSAGYPIE